METVLRQVANRTFFERILPVYRANKVSFALWRLPDTTTVHLLATDNPQRWNDQSLEEATPGFIFSPFDPTSNKIYLPADEYHTFEEGSLRSSQGGLALPEQHATDHNPKKAYHPSLTHPSRVDSNEYFLHLVGKCKDEINAGRFEKIVPSRTRTVQLPEDFDWLDAFDQLCQQYPHAMVSVVSTPATGTWMGATPEMLVRLTPDQHFHTVAIAGTQAFIKGMDPRSITWSQKEIEEQVLVVRYIISCFKKIRLREYEERGPKTIVAGNVLHLRTDFDVDMVSTNFPQLGTTMLQLLHPTSAVCGMPLKESLEFLQQHEGYDRQFYSGYLGPVNVQQQTNLYVNLRCMQLFKEDAVLYAGAGVLSDSDPEKEWNETEMKMNTLLKIIQK